MDVVRWLRVEMSRYRKGLADGTWDYYKQLTSEESVVAREHARRARTRRRPVPSSSSDDPDAHSDLSSDDEYYVDPSGLETDYYDFGLNLYATNEAVPMESYGSIQRNAAKPRDVTRKVPRPIVITVKINGEPARALVDTGSMGDFMSTKLADQLQVQKITLAKPLALHLAVQGSRSVINSGAKVDLKYSTVNETRYFDICNVKNYDIILGTPWLFQHKVMVGFNEPRIIIGSPKAVPIEGRNTAEVNIIASRAMELADERLEEVREHLRAYARPLCKPMHETPLPPLRAINHEIPLIDESKIYPWRPSRCPQKFREQWNDKRNAYLKTGRWKMTTSSNTVPMLLIPKGASPEKREKLRTVFDLRARNANTRKMASPLPDIDSVLRRVASKKYRSIIDGADAYEQIRIKPEHVERTAVTTPDGNIVSYVIQQGDTNGPSTFQTLMNHIFGPYLGQFLDVYLDDIIIYSDSLEDHVSHVKQVIDILRREKFYLSEKKLDFLPKEMKILGRVIDSQGIKMDPAKVDAVAKWPTPTNRDALRRFLGAIGYLADDIAQIRAPLGILSELTGDIPFRWGYTESRAFQEAKRLASSSRDCHRAAADYSPTADPVWLVSDGCSASIGAVIIQGKTWKEGKVLAFYSAKLNPAQQNYPTHEIEMLGGVEAMLRHRDILQGCQFTWITDHKGLIHLVGQKNLSGRQARWLEKISEFDFTIEYVAGTENVLADALSRIYVHDAPGTVRGRGAYTYHDVIDNDQLASHDITMPVLVNNEAADGLDERVETYLGAIIGHIPAVSKEFAKRHVANKTFVLKGPREQTPKGASVTVRLILT